ncbi:MULTISPECIES: chemotaxis protein CheW [unclassified Paludibacterium]|uniref:chemotaxis protein CheW n=1 Tax=unclassified Paludibacterium TaxID=2618429 RepID=UPI00207B2D3A|nr:chemotaxis protein CheW [Paludibacterium sp. B53371]BEV71895.1 chemotaxis protein CheW [Paludibacterium sp. THUN1379]
MTQTDMEDPALAAARELLVFTLGAEQYAIDILKVQEIRGYESVTRIAGAPNFIKGVVNLRGSIVPIVDMRLKFDLGDASYTPFTVVIILNVLSRTVGIVVDGVSDVIQLKPEAIRPAPEFGAAVDTAYIEGLTPVGDSMVIVMDIERLMSSAEMSLMEVERHAQSGQQLGGVSNG